jgi:hypothetical protein
LVDAEEQVFLVRHGPTTLPVMANLSSHVPHPRIAAPRAAGLLKVADITTAKSNAASAAGSVPTADGADDDH